MNPTEYYQRHAKNHAGNGDTTRPIASLGGSPSETDIALFWLRDGQGSILDIGCASLILLQRARKVYGDCCGVDIAELPQWQQNPEIKTRLCDLNDNPLPFADESFDAVTCLMVMEHVFDPYHLASEIRRVLKNHGRAVIAVPNIANIKRRLEIACGRLPITASIASFDQSEGGWDGYHLHYFTKGSLEWLLRRQGLRPLRWTSQGRVPWLKRLWPSLFGNDLVVLVEKCEADPALPFTP